MLDTECQPCPAGECQSVFDRVVVSYLTVGGARIMWELLPTFTDPRPLTFRLQVGSTANPDADDWADVGLPVVDQYFAVDPEQRVWGKSNWTHYRVLLTTARGSYYSDPVGGMGTLAWRDWCLARSMVHSRRVAYRYGPGGQLGYLLKRRWTGQPCTRCLDRQTKEVRDPACPNCYGTGFECGYFYPMSCVWAELSPRSHRTELDAGQNRGTVDDIVVQADMLMTELLGEDDVWVNRRTDDRYYVHRVAHNSEVRGVPIAANVELRLVPFSSVIYTIPIPDQLAALAAGLE